MDYARKARTIVKKYGGTITGGRIGMCWDYSIDAPDGHIWSGTDLHYFVAFCYDGPKEWRDEMWQDVIERVADGVEPCPFEDCEICEDIAAEQT